MAVFVGYVDFQIAPIMAPYLYCNLWSIVKFSVKIAMKFSC